MVEIRLVLRYICCNPIDFSEVPSGWCFPTTALGDLTGGQQVLALHWAEPSGQSKCRWSSCGRVCSQIGAGSGWLLAVVLMWGCLLLSWLRGRDPEQWIQSQCLPKEHGCLLLCTAAVTSQKGVFAGLRLVNAQFWYCFSYGIFLPNTPKASNEFLNKPWAQVSPYSTAFALKVTFLQRQTHNCFPVRAVPPRVGRTIVSHQCRHTTTFLVIITFLWVRYQSCISHTSFIGAPQRREFHCPS